jgi:hypothetical protein
MLLLKNNGMRQFTRQACRLTYTVGTAVHSGAFMEPDRLGGRRTHTFVQYGGVSRRYKKLAPVGTNT